MSTSERPARDAARDDGFSLVEIVVAMSLLAVVLVASLPMFLSTLRSTVVTKQQTQAKNLAQERLESIRNLRFHIAAQNGPYLDLLDVYYTDAHTSSTRPPVTVGSDVLTGAYVATGGGTDLEPTAPYYRVGIASLAGAPGFSQVVTAQFLEADGRTVLPSSRFQGSYDSQTAGDDAPPTLTVRVSVITSWVQAGVLKRFRTSTLVVDARPQPPVIQSQARAVAVEVSSTAADASSLVLQGGVASLDGAQSSGSSVSGYATGAVARRTGRTVVEGLNARFQLPVSPVVTAGSSSPHTPSGCAWAGFGRSTLDNVTGDVASGLPKAPANVDAGTPYNAVSGRLEDSSANSCGVLGFTSAVDGGTLRTDAVGLRMGGSPLARVADGGGSATAVSGSAYVTATSLLVNPQRTRSGVRAAMARPLVLFPGTPDNPGGGLVTAQLTSARVDCTSGTTTTPGTVAAAYSLTLRWWGSVGGAPATWHSAVYAYDSSVHAAPVLQSGTAFDPAATLLSDGQPLSNLVTGGAPVGATTGGQSGQRGFPGGILTLTTASTLANESQPGYSAVKVELGQLTCVADDQR